MASDIRDFLPERSRSPGPVDERDVPQNDPGPSGDTVPPLRVSFKPERTLSHDGIRSPKRNSTINSTASSVIPAPWKEQFVLSLDGGGIRGYSSLLILQRLVDIIARLEGETEDGVASSYHPCQIPQPDEAVNEDTREELGGWLKAWKEWREKPKRNKILESYHKNAENHDKDQEEAQARRAIRSRYLPCHYFDYIGGTSTGGLISIMLSRLRMSVDDAMEEYENLAGYVFGHPRLFSIRPSLRRPIPLLRDKYSGKRVVTVVNGVVKDRLSKKAADLGYDLFSSHERMCKTVVVSYKAQKVEDAEYMVEEPPYLFRSYDHHPTIPERGKQKNALELNPGYSQRIPIWQVARATSAAPTYFDSITIDNRKFGDGGFGSNNPAQWMYWEVCQMNGNEKSFIGMLISIGTGQSPVSRFSKGGLRKFVKYLKAAKQLAADAELDHKEMLRETNEGEAPPYHRFNVPYNQGPRQETPSGHVAENTLNGDTTRLEEGALYTKFRETVKRRKIKPLGKMALDEWKAPSRLSRRKCNTTLRDIRIATEAYLADQEVQRELELVARKLVQNRRQRSGTEHWDLFSTGIQFRCMHKGCHSAKGHKMRPHSNSLKSHLRKTHSVKEEDLDDFVRRGRVHY